MCSGRVCRVCRLVRCAQLYRCQPLPRVFSFSLVFSIVHLPQTRIGPLQLFCFELHTYVFVPRAFVLTCHRCSYLEYNQSPNPTSSTRAKPARRRLVQRSRLGIDPAAASRRLSDSRTLQRHTHPSLSPNATTTTSLRSMSNTRTAHLVQHTHVVQHSRHSPQAWDGIAFTSSAAAAATATLVTGLQELQPA